MVGHFLVCPREVGKVADPPPQHTQFTSWGVHTSSLLCARRRSGTALLCPSQSFQHLRRCPRGRSGGHAPPGTLCPNLSPPKLLPLLWVSRAIQYCFLPSGPDLPQTAEESCRELQKLLSFVSPGEVNEGSVAQTCLSARDHGSVFHLQILTVFSFLQNRICPLGSKSGEVRVWLQCRQMTRSSVPSAQAARRLSPRSQGQRGKGKGVSRWPRVAEWSWVAQREETLVTPSSACLSFLLLHLSLVNCRIGRGSSPGWLRHSCR